MSIDDGLTAITPFVYVTAAPTVHRWQSSLARQVDCVINLAVELPHLQFPAQTHVDSVKYPIFDLPSFPALIYFDHVADRIAANVAANRRTLLYCHQGRSRSITFLLAYLIKHHRLPLSTAFLLVQQKRHLALPNIGFWNQLKLFESYQHG